MHGRVTGQYPVNQRGAAARHSDHENGLAAWIPLCRVTALGESLTPMRIAAATLIVSGLVMMKLSAS